MKKDAKRYTRVGFLNELDKARIRYTFPSFNGFRCTRQDVPDVIESELLSTKEENFYDEMLDWKFRVKKPGLIFVPFCHSTKW